MHTYTTLRATIKSDGIECKQHLCILNSMTIPPYRPIFTPYLINTSILQYVCALLPCVIKVASCMWYFETSLECLYVQLRLVPIARTRYFCDIVHFDAVRNGKKSDSRFFLPVLFSLFIGLFWGRECTLRKPSCNLELQLRQKNLCF